MARNDGKIVRAAALRRGKNDALKRHAALAIARSGHWRREEGMCDLFISYRSHDLPWAKRLYGDLRKYLPGIEIFWNRTPDAIEQGASWPEELKKRARDTKHMIAIWSNKAAESNEVRQEIADFQASVHQNPKKNGVERRLLYMPLEGEATGALEQAQNLFDIRHLSTYDPNVDDRGTAKLETHPHREGWQRILRIIIDTVQNAETTQPVNLAVLVTTKSSIDGFDYDLTRKAGLAPAANEYLAAAGLTLEQAKERYGDTALDWKPFFLRCEGGPPIAGSERTIVELMEELRMIMNSELEPRYRFHWIPYDLHSELVPFKDSESLVRTRLDKLTARPSVIIVDGFSLYNLIIQEWFLFLEDYAVKEHIVIVSLAPQNVPTAAYLYNALRFKGKPVFDGYFRPKIPPDRTFAHCRLNVEHMPDIARLIRSSLGRYQLEKAKTESESLRKMGD